MNKRAVLLICVLVMALGLLVQFNRMDGLLRLLPSRSHDIHLTDTVSLDSEEGRDQYLIIYDPLNVQSVLTRHNIVKMLAQQKKSVTVRKLNGEALPAAQDDGIEAVVPAADGTYGDLQSYKGVLLITGNLEQVAGWEELCQYVAAGGNMAVLEHVEEHLATEAPARLQDIGVTALQGVRVVPGLQIDSDFLLGGRGLRISNVRAYNNESAVVQLAPGARVAMSALDGVPLLWEYDDGAGKIFVYNGQERDDKTNLGVYSAIVSHMGEDTLYPVMAAKLFYIDDFPAPVPEGNESRIYEELHTDTAGFFRNIWWPYMQQNAKDFGLKYTGVIIETYGDQVEPPFEGTRKQESLDSAIIYGRELLNMGGELGLHGYNHQPLAPAGYNQAALDYVPWPDESAMVAALTELRRYVKSLYPDYEFRVYVPPSDILSPEGRDAVCQVFPEVKTFASLHDGLAEDKAYYQDFEQAADGRYELPRLTSGYIPTESMQWDFVSAANYIGIFSHFVHPDEIMYPESRDKTWAQMEAALQSWLTDVGSRFPWLQAMTASEGTEALSDYLSLDYRVRRSADHIDIVTNELPRPVHFVLRTEHEPDEAQSTGCTIAPAGEYGPGVYIVTMNAAKARIVWRDVTPESQEKK